MSEEQMTLDECIHENKVNGKSRTLPAGFKVPRKIPYFIKQPWARVTLDIWLKPNKLIGVLLSGDPCTGKNSTVEHACALHKYDGICYINCDPEFGREDFKGHPRLKVQEGCPIDYLCAGALVLGAQATELGYKVVLFFDEFNDTHTGVQMSLNGVLNGDGGFFNNYESKWVSYSAPKIALACNDGFAGTREIAHSTRDRCVPQFSTPLSQSQETQLLIKHTRISTSTATLMANAAHAIRIAAKGGNPSKPQPFQYFMTTRALLECATLIQNGLSLSEAWKISVIGRAGNNLKSQGIQNILLELSKAAKVLEEK